MTNIKIKNAILAFKPEILPQEVNVQSRSGVYYFSTYESNELPVSANSDFASSQVIDIDRSKYSKFKIVGAEGSVYLAVSGSEGGRLRIETKDAVKTNTEISFASTTLDGGNPLDYRVNYYSSKDNDIVTHLGVSVSLSNTSKPNMSAEDFASLKIVLMK